MRHLRLVTIYGVTVHGVRYWHEALPEHLGKIVLVDIEADGVARISTLTRRTICTAAPLKKRRMA